MKLNNYEFIKKVSAYKREEYYGDTISDIFQQAIVEEYEKCIDDAPEVNTEEEMLDILALKGDIYAEDEFDNTLQYNYYQSEWEVEDYAEETYSVQEIIEKFDLEGLEEFNNGEYTFELDDAVYLKENHQEFIISDDWIELFKIEK